MELTLETELMDNIRWCINLAYGVNLDLKGHSGGTMLLGKGEAARKSSRYRINSRSSTESDIIGVDNHMPSVIGKLCFLEVQGFKVNKNIVYQDNQSAILM